jgi:prepilin-type N-terminal cleavage/methylation domain-containing protein
MASRAYATQPPAGAGGFTLVEMLAALAILLIGVTTLLS